MDGNSRWVVSFIIAIGLAGIVLIVSADSACAATISGTVLDNGKTHVPGATVTLYQNGTEYVTADNPAITNTNGYYQFSGLPNGDYSVSAEKAVDMIYSTSATTRIENSDVILDLQILGYTYKPVSSTLPPHPATVTPTPTATAKPTPKPTPKPSNTLVPLPTPSSPGFEMLFAVISLGLLAVAMRPGRR